MFLRLLLLLISIILSLLLGNTGNAAVIYTPGPYILMTGATVEARFDVAEALYESGIIDAEPALERDTRTFTGVFYMNSIGWITFSSGSEYQVGLDCGGQSLS